MDKFRLRLAMIKRLSRLYLMVVLILVIGVVVVFFLLRYKPSVLRQPSPSSSPSLTPAQRVGAIKKLITKTDKKEGDLTSDYQDFKVDYLISNDEYIVTVKTLPFSDSKKKAEAWFLNQGFESGDLCLLRISFVAAKEIAPSLTKEDIIPTGCSK